MEKVKLIRITRKTPVGNHAWLEAKIGGGTVPLKKPFSGIPRYLIDRFNIKSPSPWQRFRWWLQSLVSNNPRKY